jgi:hypothetical protein
MNPEAESPAKRSKLNEGASVDEVDESEGIEEDNDDLEKQ